MLLRLPYPLLITAYPAYPLLIPSLSPAYPLLTPITPQLIWLTLLVSPFNVR